MPLVPFYSFKGAPGTLFRGYSQKTPSRKVATNKHHSSSNPSKGNPRTSKTKVDVSKDLRSRRPATGVSRGLRARSVPGVSPRVSPKMGGVRGSVRRGVPGPWAPECPKSVPRVSPECPGHLFDTPGTLSGHFLDTPELRAPGHPVGHPPFSGTLSGTLRARRARETPVAAGGIARKDFKWTLRASQFWRSSHGESRGRPQLVGFFQGKKKNTYKHKQICGIVPGLGGCQKFVDVVFFFPFLNKLWGRKNT